MAFAGAAGAFAEPMVDGSIAVPKAGLGIAWKGERRGGARAGVGPGVATAGGPIATEPVAASIAARACTGVLGNVVEASPSVAGSGSAGVGGGGPEVGERLRSPLPEPRTGTGGGGPHGFALAAVAGAAASSLAELVNPEMSELGSEPLAASFALAFALDLLGALAFAARSPRGMASAPKVLWRHLCFEPGRQRTV